MRVQVVIALLILFSSSGLRYFLCCVTHEMHSKELKGPFLFSKPLL